MPTDHLCLRLHRGQPASAAFARLALEPQVVLSAADTDVIKTYVREGMGLG